jgi:pimeloyl-ACP methyl ester carboxylesterase
MTPEMNRAGRARLARDGQQWEFDRAVKETGRVMHFQPDGRGSLPRSVRSHAMISKHLGRRAQSLERLAADELAAGHPETAMDLYFEAASAYGHAQHPVLELNEEKRLLHSGCLRCYDQVRRLAPYEIEHIDVEWDGGSSAGNLHLRPGEGARPCIFFVPGCDVSKEMYPHPRYNHAHQRDMHIFAFDGPGQAETNLRDVPLRADNYEIAATAAITMLLDRPEVSEVAVYGQSFGSFWAVRTAASDPRVKVLVAPWMSGCDRYYLMNEESPRFKQLFAHLTRAGSEAELDAILADLTNHDDMARIACPTLLAIGEYDPRSPLEEVFELYERLQVPRELWVYADQHHMLSLSGSNQGTIWLNDTYAFGMDWIRDRLAGRPLANDGEVLYVEPNGPGPAADGVAHKRHWYD